jgi:hypothetical protein
MPTEIRRPASQLPRCKGFGLNSLTIAAVIAFVFLHLVSGIMLTSSHASSTAEVSASAVPDDDAECSARAKQQERSLPYD